MRRFGAGGPALAAALLLAACGEGDGGGVRGTASNAPLSNQWGLSTVKADRAYARMEARDGVGTAPGTGQTVAVIDSGIDTAHRAFAGTTVTERFLAGATDETGVRVSHGTAVASVIAANPPDDLVETSEYPRGVAWGADIAMLAIPLGEDSAVYVPVSPAGGDETDNMYRSLVGTITGWSEGGRTIDFANASIGFSGIIEQYSEPELRNHFGDAIAVLAQTGATEKTVFVWAAGNAHGKPCDRTDFTGHPELCTEVAGETTVDARSAEILAGLTARIAELRGHHIAVVAVGRDGAIAPFSNRCGIAAQWCIAAPGVDVRVAYFGPTSEEDPTVVRGVADAEGTSFAAPMVTGGLVVLKHRFREQLSNTALVARLLATADKGGIYRDSSVYGQGLMDLDAATAPVGTMTVALGERVGGPGGALLGTRFTSGGPLGNAVARALGGHEIAAFDTLGAPFWLSLGDLAATARGPSTVARLRSVTAPARIGAPGALRPRLAALAGGNRLRLGVMQAPSAGAAGGHLALAGGALALGTEERYGLGIAAFSTEGIRGRRPATGAALSWRPDGSPLGLTGGWVGERETMLGSATAGAFGQVSGASAFAGMEGRARIGRWRLGAAAEIGTVRAAPRGGMIARVSPLTTSAFALAAERILENGDGVAVSLAQPLRVEAGRARLSIPVGRGKDGRVLRRSLSAGLAPSGRQIDIAAQWRRSLTKGGEVRLGAKWTRQPGHDAAARPDLTLLAGWRYAF